MAMLHVLNHHQPREPCHTWMKTCTMSSVCPVVMPGTYRGGTAVCDCLRHVPDV